MRPFVFEEDKSFWYETLRVLGQIPYGGGDLGEVLRTARMIKPGDFDSWHGEWLATADRTAGEAAKSLVGGHRVSARDAFLRASNYYRAAEFFMKGLMEQGRHA